MEHNLNSTTGNITQLVECPRCGKQFELSETFRAQFDEEKRREVENAVRESEAAIRAEAEKASQESITKSENKAKESEAQLQAYKETLKKREAEIRAEAEKASQESITKSEKKAKESEARLQAYKETLKNREAEIRAEAEKEADRRFGLEREEQDLKNRRLEDQVINLQRQLKQGAAELQGEVLEEHLKHQLQTHFPVDIIADIGRGRTGADLTQEVKNAQLATCGVVVWEAKRTKHWNDEWLAKVKADADRIGAHLRVIVSQTLPKDVRNFGQKDGVWVSNIECAVPLAIALRSQLIESANLQRAMQGQGLKTEAIYQYLTSPRFSERIQRMVETWQALEKQVASEERAMRRQWKERRKQLARMEETTIEMFTDFTAILGQEIPQVPGLQLEALPSGDDSEVIDI